MPEWNDILHIIKTAAVWFQQYWAAVVAALALLGIGIDRSPWIKINPIKSLFKKIGTCFGNYLNSVFTDSVAEIEAKIDEQTKRIEILEHNINQDKAEELEDKINELRWQILDFANAQDFRDYDIEMYGHIEDVYKRYERIIEEHHLTNGRVDAAHANINRKRLEKFGY